MNRDDETPVERPIIEITDEKFEHLCYFQTTSDGVRVWRNGLAEDCAICQARTPKSQEKAVDRYVEILEQVRLAREVVRGGLTPMEEAHFVGLLDECWQEMTEEERKVFA